jgi:hypothetical protein
MSGTLSSTASSKEALTMPSVLDRALDRLAQASLLPPPPRVTHGGFFAGDVRHGSIKRVASAVGEGAMAVQQVHRFLAEQKGRAQPVSRRCIPTARMS